LGRRGAGGGAGAVAGVRRRARPPLPDRGRHPRRRRLRPLAGCRRRAATRGRGRRARPGAARRGRSGHLGPGGDRRRAEGPHGVKVVAVASGKGGVGKSTVSLNVARALAERGAGVGLLDADVYGPDIPLMLGLKQTRELKRWLLGRNRRFGRVELEPVDVLGLKVMSVGFLLAEAQAMTMPGMLVHLVSRQLIRDVR